MKRPIILTSAGPQLSPKGTVELHLYKNYAEAISLHGGTPVIAASGAPEDVRAMAAISDGLFLTGGPDVSPELYGETDRGKCYGIDSWRDEIEYAMIKAFVDARKPIFCVCRGFQTINVYFGGSLIQDIPDQLGFDHPNAVCHDAVSDAPDSLIRKSFGEKFTINSYHHQALAKIAPGFVVTATACDGKIVEAIEHESLPIVGVQWHPERMTGPDRQNPEGPDMKPLFDWFITAARG